MPVGLPTKAGGELGLPYWDTLIRQGTRRCRHPPLRTPFFFFFFFLFLCHDPNDFQDGKMDLLHDYMKSLHPEWS
jgi:hypothetical protein